MKAVAAVLVAALAAALVAGVSGRGADLRNSQELPKEIEKIIYTGDLKTKICLKSGTLPASETVTMVMKIDDQETDFEMDSKEDNCGLFPTALKPADGEYVEYSLFFESAGGQETGEVKAHVDFTFEDKSKTETLSCGGQTFERSLRADVTDPAANCLDDDAGRDYCYTLKTVSLRNGDDDCTTVGTDGFEYCQKAASDLQNDEIAYVKSLNYGGEIILEKSAGSTIELSDVKDVIVVQDVAGQNDDPQVLSYTDSTPVTLAAFKRGATGGKYTVCAVGASAYSDSSIDDINIIGKHDAEYYQFGFKYPDGSPSSYTAESGGVSVAIDCSALNAGDDTRCYGYLEAADTNPLKVTFKDVSVATRQLSIIVEKDQLAVTP